MRKINKSDQTHHLTPSTTNSLGNVSGPIVLKTHRVNTTQSHHLHEIHRENERLVRQRDQLKADIRRKRALAKENMRWMVANQEELGRLLNGQNATLGRKLGDEARTIVSGIPDTIGKFAFSVHFDEASNPQLRALGDIIRSKESQLKSAVAEHEESARKLFREIQALDTAIADVERSRVPDVRDIMKMRRVLSAPKGSLD